MQAAGGTKAGSADTCVRCLQLQAQGACETITTGARRFMENSRATKFEKALKSMKGVEVDVTRSVSQAKAVYDPKAALPLGSDTHELNTFDLGDWLPFDSDERVANLGERGLYAAMSALDIEELLHDDWEPPSPFDSDERVNS